MGPGLVCACPTLAVWHPLDIVLFVLVYISYVQYCVAICMRAK